MTSNNYIVDRYLRLYFDWNFIKTKELVLKSNNRTDRHAFYILDEDGDILHGWIMEPYKPNDNNVL